MFDVLIDDVKLLNLKNGKETVQQVALSQGKIAAIFSEKTPHPAARKVIHGKGAYLFPGFIDFHTHLFQHGSGFGIDADQLLTAGITTAVDMGSSGYANYPAFHQCDLVGKKAKVKAYLNISPVGQPGKGINEPLNSEVLSLQKIEEILDRYPGEILGLKIRVSTNIVGDLKLEPLKTAVEFGEKLGLPVCVHTTNPPESASAIAEILRPGDIYCHL